jgi:hypothetical protein
MATPNRVYVIDTNVWMELTGQANFSKIRRVIEDLSASGRLRQPSQWFLVEAKRLPRITAILKPYKRRVEYKTYGPAILDAVDRVVVTQPMLIDLLFPYNPSDPWLIAIALVEGYTVVTSEKRKGSGSRRRIPFVCRALNVSCINKPEFLDEVGIK